MAGRDLFAGIAAGFADPTLENLSELLPDAVRWNLFSVNNEAGMEGRLRELAEPGAKDEAAELHAAAELILWAGVHDREDIEPILRRNGIKYGNTDSNHALVHELITKITLPMAKLELDEVVKPGSISALGTFADFKATDHDLSKIAPLKLAPVLERELEERISKGANVTRRVKVKVTWAKEVKRLVVGIYFQRPNADGRDIAKDKRLITKSFAQPCSSTFVTLRRGHKRVIVTFRSPSSSTAQHIRQALSVAVWGKPSQVSMHPMASYDLNVFRKPNFKAEILPEYKKKIREISFADIQVEAASGNTIVIRAPRRADVLDDYRQLERSTRVLDSAVVEKVTLKFLSFESRSPIITKATVQPKHVALNELYRGLVEDHLEYWGVRSDGD